MAACPTLRAYIHSAETTFSEASTGGWRWGGAGRGLLPVPRLGLGRRIGQSEGRLVSDPHMGAEGRRVGGEAGGGQGLGDATRDDEGDAVGEREGGVHALLDEDRGDAGGL